MMTKQLMREKAARSDCFSISLTHPGFASRISSRHVRPEDSSGCGLYLNILPNMLKDFACSNSLCRKFNRRGIRPLCFANFIDIFSDIKLKSFGHSDFKSRCLIVIFTVGTEKHGGVQRCGHVAAIIVIYRLQILTKSERADPDLFDRRRQIHRCDPVASSECTLADRFAPFVDCDRAVYFAVKKCLRHNFGCRNRQILHFGVIKECIDLGKSNIHIADLGIGKRLRINSVNLTAYRKISEDPSGKRPPADTVPICDLRYAVGAENEHSGSIYISNS